MSAHLTATLPCNGLMKRSSAWHVPLRARLSALVLAVAAVAASAVPTASAAPAAGGIPRGAWTGTSTNMDRTFNYGKVSFTVGKGVVTNFKIEGVTVSGCGGYRTIVVPRLSIKGRSIAGSYEPVPGIDDVVIVPARFVGGKIVGTFTEGPTCSGAGRFVATPR